MRRNGRLLVVMLLAAGVCSAGCAADQRDVIFSDDFSGYADEAVPTEQWSPFSGHWVVKDGVLHQDHGGFDHGIVVRDLYLRCDYRIEAKVKLVGGGAGAGWYWNVYDALTGESGNMLRYDGNRPIMYGWMAGRGFLGTGGATGELFADDRWHAMRMDVNNSVGTFDVYWDGEKIVDAADMYHRSGYVGLECSLGHSAFDDVTISVAEGTDWRGAPRGKVTPEWVRSLALLPDGNIVYPVRNMHRIQIVTPNGRLVREFGEPGEKLGQLNLPMAVASDTAGRMYVTESGNHRVQVFDAKGQPLRMLAPTGDHALKQPYGVAVEANGRVWVCDSGNSRLVCFAEDGSVVTTVGGPGGGPAQFNKPRHLRFIMGKLYVADMGNKRVQIFDPANPQAAPMEHLLGSDVKAVSYDGKGTFAAATAQGVQTYDNAWRLLKDYSRGASGGVSAEDAVFDAAGHVLVADGWSHRILVLSPKLSRVEPAVSEVTTTSAVVTWDTDLPTPTRLWLLDKPTGATIPPSTDYAKAKKFGDGTLATAHRVELAGLTPATRHTYALASPVRTIPDGSHSVDYRFVTAAPAGTMAYAEVPLAVLCYTHVTFEGHKNPDGSPREPSMRDETWFQNAVKAHEAMRKFYWVNSLFRLDTKCFYLRVTRPVDWPYLGSSSEEVYKDVQALAKREGMKPTDFGAVIVIGGNCCYAYPWPTPWWGGKLTYTTGCCFAGGGDTWLSTHEFHHLTEGWMRMINYPIGGEGGYGFADAPWGHPGAVGENFDFLAHTLRYVPAEIYLKLAVGELVVTADKDGDAVPDAEPRAPLDEKRAGTSPGDKYSYKNGLTDLQSLTAEVTVPAVRGHTHPLLTREINLKYPFAVYDYDFERTKKSPTIDGKLAAGEWDTFISTPNAVNNHTRPDTWTQWRARPKEHNYTANTYLNWDDEYLYVAATAPYQFGLGMTIDGNADGFFQGKDNARLGVQVPRDETKGEPNTVLPPPGVAVWNNVEPVKQTGIPTWTNEVFDKRDGITWAWGKADNGWYVIEVAIPRCTNVGLDLVEGERIAILLSIQGYLPPTDKNKDPRYGFELLDTGEYAYFELAK